MRSLLKTVCAFIMAYAAAGGVTTNAQDQFEDFFDSADDQFKQMKRQADEEFSQMKAEVDAQFGELLANAWREFELARGIVRDETPKPDTPPVAEPVKPPSPERPAPQEPRKIPVIPQKPPEPKPVPAPPVPPDKTPRTEETIRPVPRPEPVAPLEERKQPTLSPYTLPIAFDFYKTRLSVTGDSRWRSAYRGAVSEKGISTFWDRMSGTDFLPFIREMQNMRSILGLNDWGYCLLFDAVSDKLYGQESAYGPLFIWFMLIKSGYDARIGYNGNRVFLLVPSTNTVFGAPFYTYNNKKYYITLLGNRSTVSSLYSYNGTYPGASKAINFTFTESPRIFKDDFERKLTFRYMGRNYTVAANINRTVIDFLDWYPQTDLAVYFGAGVAPETDTSLIAGLRPIIAGKTDVEAVTVILRFVQLSLKYQTDQEQFGVENYLFPEESLFYPYCDCEDRSFLFAYLVKKLAGLDVIGLQYPGHVATAVRFKNKVPGDAVVYNDADYVICDPTYMNAGCGQCMPQYRGVEPVVISFMR